ncbi:MAG: hypothetical protein HYZ16_01185 [Bacteroidetes bacterium]|jgi:hypothetical protein|nr:hypothetical protein [Bacteroidota bacterium]
MNNQAKLLVRGLLPAMSIPLLGIAGFYLYKFAGQDLSYFIQTLTSHSLMAPVISISLLPNVLLFFYYINRQRYKQGQGVIFALLLYGLAIVYFKFFA